MVNNLVSLQLFGVHDVTTYRVDEGRGAVSDNARLKQSQNKIPLTEATVVSSS